MSHPPRTRATDSAKLLKGIREVAATRPRQQSLVPRYFTACLLLENLKMPPISRYSFNVQKAVGAVAWFKNETLLKC